MVRYSDFGGDMEGCFDDGTVLMKRGQPSLGKVPSFEVRLYRLGLDGRLVHAFPAFQFRSPSMVTHMVHPSFRVAGQRVYISDGATSEIRVYRADGRLIQIIRSADRPRRITAGHVERELQGPSRAFRGRWHPETYPTYTTFLVDPNGRVWVEDFETVRGEKAGWTAFDPQRRLIGRLEVPRKTGKSHATVVGFGKDEVQILSTDEDGFAHLVFHPPTRIIR